MITTIQQDITKSKAKYIAHQCNCLTTGSSGVAAVIFSAFPYADVYQTRTQTSWKDMRDQPGTIQIMGNGKDQRFVINMFAQLFPGRSKYAESELDGVAARQNYFKKCLDLISEIKDLESIAFPYKIGCSLAGGDWNSYYQMLVDFSEKIKGNVEICRIED